MSRLPLIWTPPFSEMAKSKNFTFEEFEIATAVSEFPSMLIRTFVRMTSDSSRDSPVSWMFRSIQAVREVEVVLMNFTPVSAP